MDRVTIDELHIEKIRHLEDIDIQIPQDGIAPRHLILTGKNGSGKSSLLDAIAGYIDSVCDGSLQGLRRRIRDKDDQYLEYRNSYPDNMDDFISNLFTMESDLASLKHRLQIAQHGIDMTFNTEDNGVRGLFLSGDCLFAYFHAQRKFEAVVPTSIEKVVFSECYGINDSPRELFVKYLLDLKMTQALALSGGRKERANEISVWFDKLRDVLRDVYEDPTLELEFDEETYRFSICEQGREPFDFNEASDGFSALLDIIVGLMLRMIRKNGRSPEFNMPGIALIDEVENHLHLSLQRRVLPMLTELFPSIQFVVSTHSPFVLSSIANATIYDLETRTLVTDGLSNNTYESIVEGYFNVDQLSGELRDKYDRYKTLATKDVLMDDELLEASELELYLDEIPDYLALGITTEYQKLKSQLHAKVVDE